MPQRIARLRMRALSAAAFLAFAVSASQADQNPGIPIIKIEVVPSALRYATSRFEVRAGSTVSLMLINSCSMPHNLVLAQPGKADELVSLAMAMGVDAAAKDFVPQSPNVLAATKVLSPGSSESLNIEVPQIAGDYPYLCTFPGHGTVMRGIMRVKAAGQPLGKAVTEKFNQSKTVDALKASGVTSLPAGSRTRPLVMRTFAPNPDLDDAVLGHHGTALPARTYNPQNGKDSDEMVKPSRTIPGAIAVNFGPDLSYVWDSTECRLLYAWTGGFLDMTPDWGPETGGRRKSMDYVPRLIGTVVYKAIGPMPLQIGGKAQAKPKFLGYRLHGGIPEFEYVINGKTVHEQIVPSESGTLTCHYRIENPPDPVHLVLDPSLRASWSCEQGSWKEQTLEIPADHADLFLVVIKFQPGQTYQGLKASELKRGANSEQP